MGHDAHTTDIKKHVRIYISVFAALACLTIVTVAVSYLHLNTRQAVLVALLIASIKASLVALFFMHLVSERKVIVWILALTALMFLLVLFLPVLSS